MPDERCDKAPGNSSREENCELYTVGEVCALVGTTRKTLFYYDKIGLLTPAKREGTQNFKQYDADRIRRLKKIMQYRDAGLSIAEIRKMLDDRDADHLEILRGALTRIRAEIAEGKEQIGRLCILIRQEQGKAKKIGSGRTCFSLDCSAGNRTTLVREGLMRKEGVYLYA